jgi:hypothetical protein
MDATRLVEARHDMLLGAVVFFAVARRLATCAGADGGPDPMLPSIQPASGGPGGVTPAKASARSAASGASTFTASDGAAQRRQQPPGRCPPERHVATRRLWSRTISDVLAHGRGAPTYGQINFSGATASSRATSASSPGRLTLRRSLERHRSSASDVFLTSFRRRTRSRAPTSARSAPLRRDRRVRRGRYGTPLIAPSMGATCRRRLAHGHLRGGPPRADEQGRDQPRPTLEWLADRTGSTFVAHVHAAVAYANLVTLGGHFLHAFSRDSVPASWRWTAASRQRDRRG